MKTISTALVLIAGLFGTLKSIAQPMAPYIDFSVRYNVPASKYEVYGRARGGTINMNTGGSKIGLVLPAAASNTALSITNVAGGSWSDATQRYAPAAQPGSDFHDISTVGSAVNFPNGVEVLLFTFTHTPCLIGVRVFQPGVDPGPAASGMAGQDYASYIENALTVNEHTGVPYDNTGTVCGVLPVVLKSFTGNYRGSQTDLEWTTSSEVNTSHFEVERSEDGITFKMIGQVKVADKIGNGYLYMDHLKNVSGNTVYYRLRMVDLDGKFQYSQVINFKLQEAKGDAGIYPNPVTKGETIYLQAGMFQDYKKVSADIVDMQGKIVYRVTTGELQSKAISTSAIRTGIYFIRFSINGEKSVHKFVVQ